MEKYEKYQFFVVEKKVPDVVLCSKCLEDAWAQLFKANDVVS